MKLDRVVVVRNNKTIYRDGDTRVKVFDDGYPKAKVLNEALNQARMEETGLHVPKILGVTEVDGKWAIISEYIEGTTVAELMEEHPEKMEEYLNLLVDLQLEIHSKKAPYLNSQKDEMNHKIAISDLEATDRFDLHLRLEEMTKHTKVCHGDFDPSKIVIAEDGTPYILDWSHATQGNASADAVRTYLLFRRYTTEADAERYLTLFCEKSGTDRAYVEKWMPIVAVSQPASDEE